MGFLSILFFLWLVKPQNETTKLETTSKKKKIAGAFVASATHFRSTVGCFLCNLYHSYFALIVLSLFYRACEITTMNSMVVGGGKQEWIKFQMHHISHIIILGNFHIFLLWMVTIITEFEVIFHMIFKFHKTKVAPIPYFLMYMAYK